MNEAAPPALAEIRGRRDVARDCRCVEPPVVRDAAGYAVAAGVRGASPAAGAGAIKRLMYFFSWWSFRSQNPQFNTDWSLSCFARVTTTKYGSRNCAT